jgi:hypothetical protein
VVSSWLLLVQATNSCWVWCFEKRGISLIPRDFPIGVVDGGQSKLSIPSTFGFDELGWSLVLSFSFSLFSDSRESRF